MEVGANEYGKLCSFYNIMERNAFFGDKYKHRSYRNITSEEASD